MSGNWGWSGPGGNAPVGARLFGPIQWGSPERVPTAAEQAEAERIRQLYAPRPPGPQRYVGQGVDEWMGRQVARVLELLQPTVRPAPSEVPPEIDPSNEPNTPPPRPQDRANAAPRTVEEQNFTPPNTRAEMEMLERLRAAAIGPYREYARMNDEELSRREGQRTAERASTPSGEQYGPPAPATGESTPPASPGDNRRAVAGVTPARSYAGLDIPEPDWQRVLDAYESTRPKPQVEDPQNRILRLVASALAGGFGPAGPLGAIGGLGAGYAREADRDAALDRQAEEDRVRFQMGLAGLLGQQEQNRFNTALQRATFNRQSQVLGDESARGWAGLEVQRENAELARQLTRLRIAALARNVGMGTEPTQVLAQGVEHVVSNPGTQLFIHDAEGRTRPLTFTLGGQELTLSQLRDRLLQQRGRPQSMTANPLFGSNPRLAEQQITSDLADLLTRRIFELPPEQQQQVLRQMVPMLESRRRAGQTRLTDE